jgi:hypothetical protein
LRIDAITRARTSNVQRGEALPHGENHVTFREVLSSVRAAHPQAHALDASTPSAWTSEDADAFAIFAEANRRTESGGVAAWSALRTTAGASHRASFGVAQLSVREHLGRLGSASDAQLEGWGTSRAELEAMRARGDAAAAFYHLVVDGRATSSSASVLGMDRALVDQIRAAAARGDGAELTHLIGDRWQAETGLPPSAVAELVSTRALRDPGMREAFAAQYAHDHGVAFDPAHRDGSRMAQSARHLAVGHPEIARALTALGGDEAAATSAGHYLGVGDSAENLLGWHARGASTACSEERFAALLSSIDGTTSHAREIEDFESALAAVARISDLHGESRIETLARIGRIFHGAPARARDALFVDGHVDAPRCRTADELGALLDAMRSGRTWSDERLAGHVSQLARERSAS